MKFEHRPVCKICGTAHFAKDPHVFPDKVAKVTLDSPRPLVPGLMSRKTARELGEAVIKNEARKLQAQVDAMVGQKRKKRAGEKAAKTS